MSDTTVLRLVTATCAVVVVTTAIVLFRNYEGPTPHFEATNGDIQNHWSLIDQLKRANGSH